jgi:hypothetical protein
MIMLHPQTVVGDCPAAWPPARTPTTAGLGNNLAPNGESNCISAYIFNLVVRNDYNFWHYLFLEVVLFVVWGIG